MGTFKDPVNYVAYNINHTTTTIAGTNNVDGLERIEAYFNNDEVVEDMAADGIGMHVEIPKKDGRIEIEVMDGTAIADVLWAKAESGDAFSVSSLDSKTSNFIIKGDNCRIIKRPNLKRADMPDRPVWILSSIYLKVVGGTRAVVTT